MGLLALVHQGHECGFTLTLLPKNSALLLVSLSDPGSTRERTGAGREYLESGCDRRDLRIDQPLTSSHHPCDAAVFSRGIPMGRSEAV